MSVKHEAVSVAKSKIDPSRYDFRIVWSEEDQEFVASCAEFPSLSWLAPTQTEALNGLQDLLVEVIADIRASGEAVPEPLSTRTFSGKFTLRPGPELHRRLAMEAAQEHTTLQQYVLRKVTARS